MFGFFKVMMLIAILLVILLAIVRAVEISG